MIFKKEIVLISGLILMLQITAVSQSISGTYHFAKQELWSSIKLLDDSTFEFYYIYGAVDRFSKGVYSLEDDKVILKSDKKPGNDFEILSTKFKKGPFMIKITGIEKTFFQSIIAIVETTEGSVIFYPDDDGMIKISLDAMNKIHLFSQFYPDVPTTIMDGLCTLNRFVVRPKKSLQEFSFHEVTLNHKDGELIMTRNVLFPLTENRFLKKE